MLNIHELQYSLSILQIFSEEILPNAFHTISNDNIWHNKKVDKVDARVLLSEYENLFFINQATKELSDLLLRSLGFYKNREIWLAILILIRKKSRCTQLSAVKRAFTSSEAVPKLGAILEYWERPCSDNTRCRSESPAMAPILLFTIGFRCNWFRTVLDQIPKFQFKIPQEIQSLVYEVQNHMYRRIYDPVTPDDSTHKRLWSVGHDHDQEGNAILNTSYKIRIIILQGEDYKMRWVN
jgi:hypothetical protein